MQPALDHEDLTRSLNDRFRYRYEGDPSVRTRMVGIVFARPNSPLARSEIIPQLNDWHFRSGDHIDFYFAGYTYPHPPSRDTKRSPLLEAIHDFTVPIASTRFGKKSSREPHGSIAEDGPSPMGPDPPLTYLGQDDSVAYGKFLEFEVVD